ncbi:MAG: hypothetical protein ACJ79H_10045 [Myxococcales bacterium]
MREPGRLEPFARPGTNPDTDENSLTAANVKSPMKTLVGSTLYLDNAKTTVLPSPFVTNDIDTDNSNAFRVPKLTAALVVPVPKTPTVGIFSGRKITFEITSRGTAGDTITWTAGAGGFLWPVTGIGPFQSDFDSVLAAMGNDDVILLGAQYSSLKGMWLINALAGPYT